MMSDFACPVQNYITKFREEFEDHVRETRYNLRQEVDVANAPR